MFEMEDVVVRSEVWRSGLVLRAGSGVTVAFGEERNILKGELGLDGV